MTQKRCMLTIDGAACGEFRLVAGFSAGTLAVGRCALHDGLVRGALQDAGSVTL